MQSHTTHIYRGGTCSTNWTSVFGFTIAGSRVSGSGTASLSSGPVCPFPLGQPQIRSYAFTLSGASKGNTFLLRFGGFSKRGLGTIDYGGFALTVADKPSVVFAVHVAGRRAHGSRILRYFGPYGEDDSIASNSLQLIQQQVA